MGNRQRQEYVNSCQPAAAGAEERLRIKPDARIVKEQQRLLHESQVHQVELEMQNEDLRRAREEAVDCLERYAYLYDFAPVGYFTLECAGDSYSGQISPELNYWELKRQLLINRHFEQFYFRYRRGEVFANHLSTGFAT